MVVFKRPAVTVKRANKAELFQTLDDYHIVSIDQTEECVVKGTPYIRKIDFFRALPEKGGGGEGLARIC